MIVHLHVLTTTKCHQLDPLDYIVLFALHAPYQMIALCYPRPTLRMHFIDLKGLVDIFVEIIVAP